MRSDALANRERIICAASDVFAREGTDACVEDVARRAGVGVGTVYRRFPTKDALIHAVVADVLDRLVDAAGAARASAPPAEGFARFLEEAARLHAEHAGCRSDLWTGAADHAAARARLRAEVTALLTAAQDAGAVRADLAYEDVPPLLWALGAVAEATAGVAPRQWRRQLDLLLQGLGASPGPLSTPPLTAAQLRKVVAGRSSA